MSQHDFSPLYARYPNTINQMGGTFTSHEFILKLAQQNQPLYIDALYSYRNTPRAGGTAPFMIVHGVLAQRLTTHTDLVECIGTVQSPNIFAEMQECAQWRKR